MLATRAVSNRHFPPRYFTVGGRDAPATGPAAACAAGLRPPPIRPAAWEASVGGVRGFR